MKVCLKSNKGLTVLIASILTIISSVVTSNVIASNLVQNEISQSSIQQIAVERYFGCAIVDDGDIKCWGNNQYGQLGIFGNSNSGKTSGSMGEAMEVVDLGVGLKASRISAGRYYMCTLLTNGQTKCWGYNEYGQLGLGDTDSRGNWHDDKGINYQMGDRLLPVDLGTNNTAMQIDTGAMHSCALLNNGNVKCWGYNNYGQLGLGDTSTRGDSANEMGDYLANIDLGTGRTAIQISVGGYHTCAILDNQKLKCWGANFSGQLGLGDSDNRGDSNNEMGNNLPYIDLGQGRTASKIITGEFHSCAILDNESVKCWGHNYYGQLGLGDNIHLSFGYYCTTMIMTY